MDGGNYKEVDHSLDAPSIYRYKFKLTKSYDKTLQTDTLNILAEAA